MAANTTRTRAEDVQLFVDLDGLSLFLANLVDAATGGKCEMPLSGLDKDDLLVKDRRSGLSGDDLHGQLWSRDEQWEDDPEFIRVDARSTLLAARMFEFVTTDEGRQACQEWADRLLQIGMAHLRKADDA